jgi:hypothetical protein
VTKKHGSRQGAKPPRRRARNTHGDLRSGASALFGDPRQTPRACCARIGVVRGSVLCAGLRPVLCAGLRPVLCAGLRPVLCAGLRPRTGCRPQVSGMDGRLSAPEGDLRSAVTAFFRGPRRTEDPRRTEAAWAPPATRPGRGPPVQDRGPSATSSRRDRRGATTMRSWHRKQAGLRQSSTETHAMREIDLLDVKGNRRHGGLGEPAVLATVLGAVTNQIPERRLHAGSLRDKAPCASTWRSVRSSRVSTVDSYSARSSTDNSPSVHLSARTSRRAWAFLSSLSFRSRRAASGVRQPPTGSRARPRTAVTVAGAMQTSYRKRRSCGRAVPIHGRQPVGNDGPAALCLASRPSHRSGRRCPDSRETCGRPQRRSSETRAERVTRTEVAESSCSST